MDFLNALLSPFVKPGEFGVQVGIFLFALFYFLFEFLLSYTTKWIAQVEKIKRKTDVGANGKYG